MWRLGLGIVAFSAVVTTHEAAADVRTTGWTLTRTDGGKVVSGRGYRLLNVYNKLYVEVRAGKPASLDAVALASDNVEILTTKGGDLRCGDLFTLRVASHTLTLDSKTSRIVPVAASEAEEWKFLGCKKGANVALGQPLALVNVRRGDAWVGCRHLGTATYCWDDKQLMGIATE